MPRNLDLTALRSFLTVAEVGGVTRAAGQLHLTQSAVSMQLKRLEEGLGLELIDRAGRGVQLTPTGEQLLSYARRILALNDETVARLTDTVFEGEINLGLPYDIIYPAIPAVLAAFAQLYPRIRVHLQSHPTRVLKEMFGRGECDLILTTETSGGPEAETLVDLPLIWAGARGGSAYRARPLRFAFCRNCLFSAVARNALDAEGIPWESIVDAESDRAAEATVIADLAVCVLLDLPLPEAIRMVPAAAGLPALPDQAINLYRSSSLQPQLADALVTLLRQHYGALSRPRIAAA